MSCFSFFASFKLTWSHLSLSLSAFFLHLAHLIGQRQREESYDRREKDCGEKVIENLVTTGSCSSHATNGHHQTICSCLFVGIPLVWIFSSLCNDVTTELLNSPIFRAIVWAIRENLEIGIER